jgi:amino acid adenylation domain-containing protein
MTSGPSQPIPRTTLPELIGAQARARPSATAVRQWQDRLSYGELWAIAGRLAATLRAEGACPETPVLFCAHRTPSAVAALVGIQLAGAAYVPLDPADPPARHAMIAADVGARFVVADEEAAAVTATLGLRVLPIPAPDQVDPAELAPCPARPGNPGCFLYSFGSTGKPRGVVITHRSLSSYVTAFGAFTGAGHATRSFGFASFGSDVSVIDLFVPLAAGGEVELAGEADRSDPQRLQRFCEEHAITWGGVPVAVLPVLDPDRLPAWRTVITGAQAPIPGGAHAAVTDVHAAGQVARWTGTDGGAGRRFINCYGPAEATVCVTAFEATGRWDRPLPIGVPLANHRVHVVDEHLDEVAEGTPGELLIGGVGLARGYLGRAALTARRFVPDPFGSEPGDRLYRTGDIVAWRSGVLEFLGRRDTRGEVGTDPGSAAGSAAPSGHAERAIASIWRDVLELREVSTTANFFDVGGSSAALVAVRARIAEHFGRELPVADLFLYPTVRALAGHLQGASGAPELERAAARVAARRQRARRQVRPEQGA